MTRFLSILKESWDVLKAQHEELFVSNKRQVQIGIPQIMLKE
jgi:hypothetical protein